ncbi:uncharacterized protein LOC134275467 [Saccostrea cucullata]|uniref:uncharacterized protein LOC134275467 n=1 Tax=Saccostrea cuccullata TaxID=36930 RepID=UPI002ED08688
MISDKEFPNLQFFEITSTELSCQEIHDLFPFATIRRNGVVCTKISQFVFQASTFQHYTTTFPPDTAESATFEEHTHPSSVQPTPQNFQVTSLEIHWKIITFTFITIIAVTLIIIATVCCLSRRRRRRTMNRTDIVHMDSLPKAVYDDISLEEYKRE